MTDRTIQDIGAVVLIAPFAAALVWGWLWTVRNARRWKALDINDKLIPVCTLLYSWLIAAIVLLSWGGSR